MLRLIPVLMVVFVLASSSQAFAATDDNSENAAQQAWFDNGFSDLKGRLGDVMGEAVTSEHDDPNGSGDILQITTTGLARYKPGSMPEFFDGATRYAWLPDRGIVKWQSDSWAVPAPEPVVVASSASVSASGPVGGVWQAIKDCETPGRGWNANTNNGFFGGLQEDMTFWKTHGWADHPGGALMAPRPDMATPAQQIVAAQRGLASQGWGAWPACSSRLGLRGR